MRTLCKVAVLRERPAACPPNFHAVTRTWGKQSSQSSLTQTPTRASPRHLTTSPQAPIAPPAFPAGTAAR
jgi:hypothetical protein